MKKWFFFFVSLLALSSFVSAQSVASDGFEGGWNGGIGWAGGWYHSGDSSLVTTGSPHSGTTHLQLRRGSGYADRPISLASYSDVTFSFWAKVNSFEANDAADIMISPDGVNWTVLKHFTSADSDNTYRLYSFNVTPYGLTSGFYISIDAQMSATDDFLYFDDLDFSVPDAPNFTFVQPRWHIQFNPSPTPQPDVAYWNLDLFDISSETMQSLRANGTFVMCYFSAGSWEDWRPDASQFPSEVLGNNLQGWPGEKYLDIRSPVVRDLMAARMDLGISKGCDGFDPDNMDTYQANSGFSLTEQDEIDYYMFLADYAHTRDKKIGLKNALTIIPALLPSMDWSINEQCFAYGECGLLMPVVLAGKPVFNLEYAEVGQEAAKAAQVCPQANATGFTTLIKHQSLDAFEIPCIMPPAGNETNSTNTTNQSYGAVFASDGFENTWSGGTGPWIGNWYHEGDSSIITGNLPYNGTRHLRLRSANGYVDRLINLTGRTNVTLSFKAKVNSFEGNDRAYVLVSSDGTNWVTLKEFSPSDSDNTYKAYSFSLYSMPMTGTFYVAVDAQMSASNDQIYIDDFFFTQ